MSEPRLRVVIANRYHDAKMAEVFAEYINDLLTLWDDYRIYRKYTTVIWDEVIRVAECMIRRCEQRRPVA